jgi:hypothetical protein
MDLSAEKPRIGEVTPESRFGELLRNQTLQEWKHGRQSCPAQREIAFVTHPTLRPL